MPTTGVTTLLTCVEKFCEDHGVQCRRKRAPGLGMGVGVLFTSIRGLSLSRRRRAI